MAVFLYVTGPVAALQCNLQTAGSVASTLDPALGKFLYFENGILLVGGPSLSTFTGHFATVNAAVTSISGVVTADPEGNDAGEDVVKLSAPSGVVIDVLARP